MTREELQKAIENEETVYIVDNYLSDILGATQIKLNKDYFIDEENNTLCVEVDLYDDTDISIVGSFNEIYKTKAEADWVANMHTSRVEVFEPPMFKDLPDKYVFGFIRNGVYHELTCVKGSSIVVIDWCENYMSGTNDMDYNEENYIKAVEYARKIFLGEEK